MDIKDLSAWCKISFYNYASNPLLFVHHLYVNGKEVKDLIIPNEVTSISGYAFTGCSYLNSIKIHKNVSAIGRSAFTYCAGLTTITVEEGNSNYDSRDNCNAIIHKSTNTLIAGCTKTIIPNNVTSIESDAFKGCCGDMTSLIIPGNVKSIGHDAFYGCSNITTLRMEDGTTDINLSSSGLSACPLTTLYLGRNVSFQSGDPRYSPFFNKTNLKSLTLGSGITGLGCYLFYGCTGLKTLIIPHNVKGISSWTFEGCTGLNSIHCLSTTPPSTPTIDMSWCRAFSDIFKTAITTVPLKWTNRSLK